MDGRVVRAGVLCGLMTAGTALAGSFQPERVPASANWVMHADVATLHKTEMGRYVLGRLSEGEADRKLDTVKALFDFDPRTDLDSITAYGKGGRNEEGVAILKGRFATERLVALVQVNETYEAYPHGDHTIHYWIDENKNEESYGSVYSDGSVLLGHSERDLAEALDALDGKAKSLSDTQKFDVLRASRNAVFFMGAADLDAMQDVRPEAATLRHADSAQFVMREQNGNLEGDITLDTRSPEDAQRVQQVAQGLIAFAILAEQKRPALAGLARTAQVRMANDVVTVSFSYPVQDAIRCVEEHERHEKKETTGGNTW